MAIKITPYQKNAGGTLDEYKFASTGSIVDLNGYTPYTDSELDDIPAIDATDTVNTAVKKLDGVTRVLDNDKADVNHTHSYAGSASAGGAANTAVKLNTPRGIDGVQFDGSVAIVHYGLCSTGAAVEAKTVDCVGFTLATGSRITVKFASGNSAANPTLNVNGTGAKAIFYHNASVAADAIAAGKVYELVYDGTQYQLVGDLNTDTDTTYTGSDGVTLTGTNFTNSGVRAVGAGTANGTISVNTNGTSADVAVTGLASGAFADAYVHPATSGNKHIPSGGAAGQILKWSADGTAEWANESQTTYTASDGVTLTGTNFTNSGVRGVGAGTANGTISVNTNGTSADVAVTGLGSAAYTASTDYAASNHSHTGADIPLTGYAKASSAAAVAATDTTNQAIGKLEKSLDGKQAAGDYLTPSSDLDGSKITGTIPASSYTDTTYTGSDGITLTGTNFTNSGVRAVGAGTANGTISVNTNGTTADVAVTGLGSAAYTASTDYAAANHTHTPAEIGASAEGHSHVVADITDFPTIPTITDTYSGTSSDGMSGKAVKSAIDAALVSAYKPSGSVAYASLPTLSASVMGNVYNVSDSFTIDNRFVEYESGTTKTYPAGTEVAVINVGTSASPTYKFSVMSGFIDLSGYQLANTAVTHTASTAVGSGTKPVYVNASGVATACDYEVNKTVPADAKFTDTTYDDFVGSGTGAAAGLVPAPSTTAGTTKYLREDGSWEVPPDTQYVHPTTAGNKHIPSGGESGKILKWSADGTATWETEYSYTHPTTSGNKHVPSGGSSGQILKWSADGTATWAEEYSYTHPTTSGNKHIPSGGSAGQILKWSADGTATWAAEYSYTHPTTAGNKHIPAGGMAGKYLAWSDDGTAVWADPVDTTYTGSDGITLTGTNFTNSGVRAVSIGSTDGTISVNTNGTAQDVAVKGLQSGAFAAAYVHPSTSGNKHIPSGGSAGKVLKWTADGTAAWDNEVDFDDFVGSGASAAHGLVPQPPTTAGTSKYLCEDGSWTVPPDNNTTYTGSDGVTLTGTNFTNSGVRSIASGSTNGTISVNTNGRAAEVAVAGLGGAAYKADDYYALASHSHTGADIPLTGYAKAASAAAIAATDTTNQAIGKLEKALDGKSDTGHNHAGVYTPYAASVGSNTKFIYTDANGALTASTFEIWVTDT